MTAAVTQSQIIQATPAPLHTLELTTAVGGNIALKTGGAGGLAIAVGFGASDTLGTGHESSALTYFVTINRTLFTAIVEP